MSPFLSVVVAFSVAWLMLALWVMKIGRKVDLLLEHDARQSGKG